MGKSIVYLYVLSIAFALISNNTISCAISLIWCLIGFFVYKINNFNHIVFKMNYKRLGTFVFLYLLVPAIIIHLYSFFLLLIGLTSKDSLTSNLLTYFPILLTVVSIYLFKDKSVIYNFSAIIIAWFFSAISVVLSNGFFVIYNAIKGIFTGDTSGNLLEFHDLVFSAGYAWIWYLFSNKKNRKRSLLLFIILIFVFFVGFKRIGALAIISVTILYLIIKRMRPKTAYVFCNFVMFFSFAFSVFFVWFVGHSELMEAFLAKYNINSLSRNIFISHIMSKTSFSPTFLGFGRGSVKNEMLNTFHNFYHVHSDLVKMYYELGFTLFLGWLSFYLFILPRRFKKVFNYRSAIFYSSIIVYTLVLFLTDNTESYFACRLIRTSLPIVFALYYSEDNVRHIAYNL